LGISNFAIIFSLVKVRHRGAKKNRVGVFLYSAAFKSFRTFSKSQESNRTEMALNEKMLRIIKFPERLLLKKRQASDSPNLIKIKQIAFELELFKVSPSSEK